jgi:uncharacterized protein YndB with AHSA1/START domain
MQQSTFASSAQAAEPRAIVSGRVIDAPRRKVFKAFADPTHLTRWWGPKGFRNTFEEFDFRSGGIWRFTMHGPDGTDHANRSVFLDILEPARIVIEHETPPVFRLTITLADADGKTRIDWHMLFESAEVRDRVATFAVAANEQNFDRLQAELQSMS